MPDVEWQQRVLEVLEGPETIACSHGSESLQTEEVECLGESVLSGDGSRLGVPLLPIAS